MVLKSCLPSKGIWVSRKRVKKCAIASTSKGPSALDLLVLTQFFPPDFAATGQLIEELAAQLAQQGVSVDIFTGQPGYAFAKGVAPATERKGGVWVKRSRISQLFVSRIRGKAINGLLYTLRSIVYLARNARDYQVLLVTTAPPFLSIVGYFANIFFKLPYVCLLYDLYPDIAIELEVVKANHPIAQLWRSLNCEMWKRSAGIIVLSDSMKERIVAHCPGVAEKVSVIHSWCNNEQIVPVAKKDNWFAQTHSLTDSFVVLYSGNMGRCHDVDTLFDAACLLKDEPILFVCIGGGAKRNRLIDRVNAAELSNFKFLPYQEKSVLPYSLTAGDVSLVSVAEGMESLVAPSKLYPAMATGRPIAVVCPPNSYLKPLLAAARSGAVFNNGDAKSLASYIRALSQNADKARAQGDAGRAYVQANFTPQLISQQYLKVLKQALQQARVSKQTYHT